MFFKKLRSRSKCNPKSTKPFITRITSISSLHESKNPKVPDITISSPAVSPIQEGTDSEEKDFQQFLAKAKKDEEKAEKRRLKAAKEAEVYQKQVNMSPWASRM